jgi:hypothetical protein
MTGRDSTSISSPLLTPPVATVGYAQAGLGRSTTQTLWEATTLRFIQTVLNLYLIEGSFPWCDRLGPTTDVL